MPEHTYTTHDIARYCDVFPSSVIRWINDGKLKAYATPGGHQRVTRENLLKFLKEFRIPIPSEVASPQKRVLIVDDDADMARVISRAFGRHPEVFKAEICHSGVDALIRIGHEPPHLVVLDIILPQMDGVQVCRVLKLKPETRAIKIVAISGKKPPHSEKRLEEVGIDAFYRKPLDIHELVQKAAQLLRVDLGAAARK